MRQTFSPQLIMTNYFTLKDDPQRVGVRYAPDQFDQMQKWYDSVVRLGLSAVVFYDSLSPAFVQKHSCANVQFVPYVQQTPRSLNDERFYCHLAFLAAHPEVEHAFLTDLFDLDFLRNPFDLIDDEKYDLYCGNQGGGLLQQRKPTQSRMLRAYAQVFHLDKVEVNAGLIGGSRENLLRLLGRMVFDFMQCRNLKNTNMGVFNRCAHDLFASDRILHGHPLHSKFRGFEADGDFYVRHK